MKICLICNKQFTPSKTARKGIYCSSICRQTGNSRSSAKKRGDYFRGTGEGKTYIKRDGRHEHRIIAEKMLGRPLRKGEVVHHKDGNKKNNSSDNLLVTTQSKHILEHLPEMHRRMIQKYGCFFIKKNTKNGKD